VPPTGDRARIIQVHPSRRCNLRCRHCYSVSSPAERDRLDVALLSQAVTDAAALGYNVVSFSGGEPTIYPGLPALLAAAHGAGMTTAAVTNGITLTNARLAMLRGRLDLLAISLDGVPESHNRMRGARAFESMAARLPPLRESGIPFGFIFKLTQSNLEELAWVVEFAATNGASLLQVHPLEEVGRAREMLPGAEPDDMERAFAWLRVAELRDQYAGRLAIQLDLVDSAALAASRSSVFADELERPPADYLLSDLLSPLIVEPDGMVAPLFYGFPRALCLGNLQTASLPLLARQWQASRCDDFRYACRRVLEQRHGTAELPIFNWYRAVGEMAQAMSCA
jgi:MoaA/NifB/PqqE/SkfB family radical SAM enzyme